MVGALVAILGISAGLGGDSPPGSPGALPDATPAPPDQSRIAPSSRPQAPQFRGVQPLPSPPANRSDSPPVNRSDSPPVNPSAPAPTGWPGPDNTGVPAGTELTASGALTITDDGAVVSDLDITGCVDVRASDVTITRSRITCNRTAPAVRLDSGFTGLLLEDVEIDGQGATSVTICCGNYTIRRANIHSTEDGPRLGSNTVVEDSWIHGLIRQEGSHNDALQTTGAVNVTVRNNRLEAYNPATDDPFNAAIMIGSTAAPEEVRNLLFEGNYCNGGNYTIGIREDLNAVNIVFRRNTFGRDYRYGVVARWNHPGVSWDDSNVYADSDAPVVEP